jgi:lipopolysaccharide biosynthesis regulator YciM
MYTCSTESEDPYNVSEYLSDIAKRLFNLSAEKQGTDWVRNLQVEYLKGLQKLLKENADKSGHVFNNLIMADIHAELESIKNIVNKRAENGNEKIKKHFSYLKYLLN